MCPPLSCCHRQVRHPSPLRRQLYCLVRLLLASGSDEAPAAQRATLDTRLDSLWNCLYTAMRQYYRVPQSRAEELTEQVVHALLREACCRQSVREAVPLAEALGQTETPSASDYAPAHPLTSAQGPRVWPAQLGGGAPYGSGQFARRP
jgi:hypothetical protein